MQIAELLRILRKNEIMQLEELKKSNSAQEKDYYRVLDTFMYVYYGNPLAYLQLHPRKERAMTQQERIVQEQAAIRLKPIVSYPREAKIGERYLFTIDVQLAENSPWPYQEEEFRDLLHP